MSREAETRSREALLAAAFKHPDTACICVACMYLAGYVEAVRVLRELGDDVGADRLDAVLERHIAPRPVLHLVRPPGSGVRSRRAVRDPR